MHKKETQVLSICQKEGKAQDHAQSVQESKPMFTLDSGVKIKPKRKNADVMENQIKQATLTNGLFARRLIYAKKLLFKLIGDRQHNSRLHVFAFYLTRCPLWHL